MDNSFAALYKSFSDAELLQILEDKDNYQPGAVEAATREIENRQLNPTQWENAKEELSMLLDPAVKKQEQKQKTRKKLIEQSNQVLEEFRPSINMTLAKKIRLICYGVGFTLLYSLSKEYHLLWMLLKDFRHWDTSSLLAFLPYVIVLLALYYFWHRHPVGWIMLTASICFSVVYELYSFTQMVGRRYQSRVYDLLYPRHGIGEYIFSVLVYGYLLFYLNRPTVRDHFRISKTTQWLTLILSTVFIIVLRLV